jgi:hypothetical protein
MGTICDSHCKQQTMTFVQAPLGNRPKETSDDMSVEILLLAAVGIAAPFIAANSAVAPDMVAILGAVLAAAVGLLKAASEKRDWTQRGIVMVGTTVIGSTGPSAVIHWWWPESFARLVWQTWAILGFLSGIIGWMTIWGGILVWDKYQGKAWERAIRKGTSKFTDDEPQP